MPRFLFNQMACLCSKGRGGPDKNKSKSMKKLFALAAALIMSVAAHAQFEQGKIYVNGSLSGLNLAYSGDSDFTLGVSAMAGYMVTRDWMVYGQAGVNIVGDNDSYYAGVGGRYYIEQNGLFLGVNGKLMHSPNYTDIKPGFEVGYAFFLSRTVTVEPVLYYDQSFKDHSKYSTIGLKLGVGVYLFKD